MKEPHTVAIFGAGVMGETLLSGLLRAGHSPHDLVITERRDDRAHELTARYGVRALTNVEAAAIADTLVLVVKPQDMGALLDEIAPHVEDDNLVVSLAAGITTDFVAARLPEGRAIVRPAGSPRSPRSSRTPSRRSPAADRHTSSTWSRR